MLGLGPLELAIILIILLVIFGARKLPEIGRDLGSGMRSFKEGVTGKGDEPAARRDLDEGPRAERATSPRATEPEPVEGDVMPDTRA